MRSATPTERLRRWAWRAVAAALLAPGWAVAEDAGSPPPVEAEAERVALLQARYADLRARQLHDLNLLVGLEPEPAEKAWVMIALNQTRAEEAWALTSELSPGLDAQEAESRALAIEDQAVWSLETLWEKRIGLSPDIAEQAGLLYAELLVSADETAPAEEVLADIEATSADDLRRARAATMRGRLLSTRRDDASVREAYRAHADAFAYEPTPERRRRLAEAAVPLGQVDEAIAHYSRLLERPLPPVDTAAFVGRALDGGALGGLLARQRTPAAARAHVQRLGEGGHLVWLPLGVALEGRSRWQAAQAALEHAQRLDPRPIARFKAAAHLSAVALGLDHTADSARWAGSVARTLEALEPDTPGRSGWMSPGHRALQLLVEAIGRDPDAWADADASAVLDAYLTHFPDHRSSPVAFYARGALRASRAESCDARAEAARDFRRAHDRAGGVPDGVAVKAGVALVRSLAACRALWSAEAARPAVAAYDHALITFAGRFVESVPPPEAMGEVLDLAALAHLAAGDDARAQAKLERAVGLDGPHVADAAGHLLLTLEALGALDAYGEWAGRFAADPRLDAAQREAMSRRARAALHASAAAIPDPAERARALMMFVAAHPDAARATEALVAAAQAYETLGEWRKAEAALSDAVAREVTARRPGQAHLQLADLRERQGRFRAAAEHIEAWLHAAEPEPAAGRQAAIQAHLSGLWLALGEPARAVAGEVRRTALLDFAISALDRGDEATMRHLLDDVQRPTRSERAASAALRRCADGHRAGVDWLFETRRPVDDRILAACVIYSAEAALAEAPSGDSDPAQAFNWLDTQHHRLGALFQRSSARLPPPLAARVELRLRLVMVHLLALDARIALRGWAALPAEARVDVAHKATEAWALWGGVARALRERPPDVYTARLGAALAELVTLDLPESS